MIIKCILIVICLIVIFLLGYILGMLGYTIALLKSIKRDEKFEKEYLDNNVDLLDPVTRQDQLLDKMLKKEVRNEEEERD